jgi:hypothetical protein
MTTFAQALKKTKKAEPKTTKDSKHPIVDGGKDVKDAVDNVISAKAEIKKQKAIQTANEEVILNHVKPIQDADGFAMNHSKTYEVLGNDDSLKYVSANKFSVSIDDRDNLIELLGQDGFDERFEVKEELKAVDEIFTNEDLQKEVLDKLGDDLFARLFVHSETLKVKTDFDKKQYKLDKDTLADLRIFAKQAKPSLR